jgi:hydrogenase maturation protease
VWDYKTAVMSLAAGGVQTSDIKHPQITSGQSETPCAPIECKTLIVGYGNPDREDDGVAWHILRNLAQHLQRNVVELEYEIDPEGPSPHLAFMLQLTPEMAETIADYDYLCFIDAHTGAFDEEIRFSRVKADFQASPFTHHLTPNACVAIAHTLYGRAPQTVLLSVRGYEFGFGQTLSTKTEALASQGAQLVFEWLHLADVDPNALLAEETH